MTSLFLTADPTECGGSYVLKRMIREGETLCGSHACIAGHAAILAIRRGEAISGSGISNIAAAWLGIGRLTCSDALFFNWNDPYSIDEAIAKLEALRDNDQATAVRLIRRLNRRQDDLP